MLQLGFLKVLKGTAIYSDIEKYGIHYIKYPNYQVLYTNSISFEELRGLTRLEKVFETYYNSRIFNVTLQLVLQLLAQNQQHQNSVYDFFKRFEAFLSDKDFFARSFDLRDKFRFLFEFLLTENTLLLMLQELLLPEKAEQQLTYQILQDLMIHDFLMNTKKAALPDFLKRENNSGTKEIVSSHKQTIAGYFNDIELKKLFYMPVHVKLFKTGRQYCILAEKAILICNPITSEYCYL